MKVKIIKDCSAQNDSNISIKKYIGKIFEAQQTGSSVEIDFAEDLGKITVFEGEYEVFDE